MRRVVLGPGTAGDTVVDDGEPPVVHSSASLGLPSGFCWAEIWATDGAELRTGDATTAFEGFELPGPGAVYFKYGVFPPMAAPAVMHRTPTVDYVTIVSGEIELATEDGSTTVLRAGDTAVQLAGLHSWWNRSSTDCVMTVVMVGVDPATSRQG